MIDVILERYFGSVNITKSKLRIVRDGEVLFECEARELGYVDYTDTEKKRGTMYKCMPRGTFPLRVVTMPFNPACFKTHHTHTHRGTVIYADPNSERKLNSVMIGYANSNVAPEHRRLTQVEKCRDDYNEVVSSLWGETFQLIVKNT